ncbi:MAG: sulfotransferase domain-containing protein, partial [Nocardioidaceae bacterium]
MAGALGYPHRDEDVRRELDPDQMMSRFGKVGRRATGRAVPEDAFFFDDIRPDDTYLVSFPRSGNTYLRHLVASLVLDRAPRPGDVQDVVPDVHRSPTTHRPSRPGPLVAKSHAPACRVPARVVYLVRDGRAALVSYHRYLQARGQPTPPSPDDMLAWSGVWPCCWADHVSGWLRQLEGRDESLVVRYEDLVADPKTVLREVAAVAGLACSDDRLE